MFTHIRPQTCPVVLLDISSIRIFLASNVSMPMRWSEQQCGSRNNVALCPLFYLPPSLFFVSLSLIFAVYEFNGIRKKKATNIRTSFLHNKGFFVSNIDRLIIFRRCTPAYDEFDISWNLCLLLLSIACGRSYETFVSTLARNKKKWFFEEISAQEASLEKWEGLLVFAIEKKKKRKRGNESSKAGNLDESYRIVLNIDSVIIFSWLIAPAALSHSPRSLPLPPPFPTFHSSTKKKEVVDPIRQPCVT